MKKNTGLRFFSKCTAVSTFLLIFVGGMVTSTDSGLAVPDWPLSYGTLFPPMVGGVFYEHGHRMAAAFVGLMMLSLAVWIHFKEERAWIKILGYAGLGAVILQGLLGGITVLFYLPTAISVSHGVLAQTFFLITIAIAYSLSRERVWRSDMQVSIDLKLQRASLYLLAAVYIQLILGAVMRHTGSGLAIYDFPTMGGQWWPSLTQHFLNHINGWRFDQDLDPVTMQQIVFHLAHRVWAGAVCLAVLYLNWAVWTSKLPNQKHIFYTVCLINFLVLLQITLGIASILTLKAPVLTSLHVAGGAAILGISFLVILRVFPTSFTDLRWS